MGKFVITKRINGEFQFNLKAGNGQTVLISEGYTTKTACLNGIESIKVDSQDDSKFDRRESSTGKPYFKNSLITSSLPVLAAAKNRSTNSCCEFT